LKDKVIELNEVIKWTSMRTADQIPATEFEFTVPKTAGITLQYVAINCNRMTLQIAGDTTLKTTQSLSSTTINIA
jgi:hypothetical protein